MKLRYLIVLFFLCVLVTAYSGGISQTGNTIGGSSSPSATWDGGTVSGPSTFSSTLGVTGTATFEESVNIGTGTLTALSLRLRGDENTGVYSSVADRLDFVTAGAARLYISSVGCVANGAIYSGNAASGRAVMSTLAPSSTVPVFTFAGNTGTGIGRAAVDQPSAIAGSIEAMRWTNATTTAFGDLYVASQSNFVGTATFQQRTIFATGTSGLPSIRFAGDVDTGLWQESPNQMYFAAGGVNLANFSNTNFRIYVDMYDGSATAWYLSRASQFGTAAPNYTFAGDTNTGFHRFAADQPNIIAGGGEVQRWTATQTLILQKPVLPSIASATIDGLTAVVAGSMVFNTGSNKAQVFDGTNWQNCW